VQADALICRYCRYDFRTGQSSPPPPVPQQPSPQAPAYPPPRRTNGYAVAALVLGIVGPLIVGHILALVFGYRAKREIDASGGTQDGRGMAIAGIVLGWVGLTFSIIAVVAVIVFASQGHHFHGGFHFTSAP
jgi:hypothetical protein